MLKLILLSVLLLFFGTNVYSQSELTGIVVSDNNTALAGVAIKINNSAIGTVTDSEGVFNITSSFVSGYITINHLGYATKTVSYNQSTNFGKIVLESTYESIEEVTINGNTDLSIDRTSAITTTTMRASLLSRVAPNKQLPELLKTTPSVYATKSGGGFGDGRISIRGFNQNNTAILVNGIPMNDMENSGFYWSNLIGLEHATSAIQIQRGLGASKLAISSVGGTINFVTHSSFKNESGTLYTSIGNDAHINTQIAYSSGILENGFSTSIALGHQKGQGYIKGTGFNSFNYFLSFGLKKKAYTIQFTLLGSPQNHGQRINSYFNMATIDQHLQYGTTYNYNHGFLNGKEYNWTENYYHKPVASLSWDWHINSTSNLATTAYTTFGHGGGTSDLGRLPGNNFASSAIFRDEKGLVRFDDIVAYNQGESIVFSDGNTYQRDPSVDGYINSFRNNGLTRRAFTNSHYWMGLIANYQFKINQDFTANFGTDLRYSEGSNYIRISNLLGADAYFDFFNVNNPNNLVSKTYKTDLNSVINVFTDTDKDQKVFFHADVLVKWSGLFGNITYTKDKLSGFLQTALSNQSFKRKDYFNYLNTDPNQSTDWINILGGTAKIGLNYNIDTKSNLYINSGFYSKQPGFEVVFIDFDNSINKAFKNEKIIGFELGYGFTTQKLKVKTTLYHTAWSDKFLKLDYENDLNQGTAKVLDLKQNHKGFELESTYHPTYKIKIKTMVSIGDWIYANNVSAKAYDTEQNYVGDAILNLKGVKVQDAAQITANIGVIYKLFENLEVELNQFFADHLYAAIAPEDNWANHDVSLKLPAYTLTDVRATYALNLSNSFLNSIDLGFNVDNLFDTSYISESATNYQASVMPSENWMGINKNNKVFLGFGRTWNFSAKLNF